MLNQLQSLEKIMQWRHVVEPECGHGTIPVLIVVKHHTKGMQ
jgi:hypothetical protein